ncbi:DinB family protein [Aestuariimicrobium soli]|uniref:DinB family protein n=1 Tax=Aestuariimicrobium soli TaxID=2035834 RepID=UPI003EBA39D9
MISDDPLTTDEQGRPEPPLSAGEAETLLGFLDFQRATLEWKTKGVQASGLRATLHPTSMTLAGLLKHLAWVEDFWFVHTAGHQPMPEPWAGVDWSSDENWEWTSALTDEPDEVRGIWQQSVVRSRKLVAGLLAGEGSGESGGPLADTHPAWGGQAQVSLRWILTHMIEEYARHNGHADLLREAVDGETGE